MSGGRKRRRRGARAVIVAAAVVPVAAAAAAGLGLAGDGGSSNAGSQLPPSTTTVTRQTLLDTQTENGSLDFGDSTALGVRLGGTLTGLPAVNKVLKRGDALYKVDNAPVLLMYGKLPAYRALSPGISGADVKQFETDLWALGYRGFTVDNTYSYSTANAVEQWQDDLGITETGTVPLGRVVYLPGQIRVTSHDAVLGGAVQNGTEVLHYTGTSQVITVDLDVADRRLAKQGAAVTVTLPDDKTAQGKISQVVTVITSSDSSSSSGDDPQTQIEVTVTVANTKALSGLDEATVRVAFTATKHENVLTVPVTALLALAEGGYGVQVVEGDSTRIVPVQTGMFASGRVEITGTGLAQGTTVGVPA